MESLAETQILEVIKLPNKALLASSLESIEIKEEREFLFFYVLGLSLLFYSTF